MRGRACQREEASAVDAGDLVFVGFAHVEDLDAELGIVQGALQFLDGDFVGMQRRGDRWGRAGAEGLVVNEPGDNGLLAAKGALGVAPELEFAELHVEGVEQQQPVEEGGAPAKDELQDLRWPG